MIARENGRRARDELPAANGQRQLRVLVADHDGLARAMMRTALRRAEGIAIVLSAGDGRQALELARYYHPDVAIIDTALPPDGAVALIAALLHAAPGTRIVTVSVDDHQTALAGLHAGAIGHIDKDVNPDELARLVARAADGQAIIPQHLMLPLLERLRELPHTGWRPLHSRLTTREWEIIELLTHGASTQTIAERLVLSPTTIYSHIKSVLRKLGVHSRQEAITAAHTLRKNETTTTPHTDPTKPSPTT